MTLVDVIYLSGGTRKHHYKYRDRKVNEKWAIRDILLNKLPLPINKLILMGGSGRKWRKCAKELFHAILWGHIYINFHQLLFEEFCQRSESWDTPDKIQK